MTWIQTYTGKQFDLLDPQPEMVDILDIAHGLSMLCRFTGATEFFYSVAQHSVLVSKMVTVDSAFAGLMHDATEAYVGDVSRPLKAMIPEYAHVEAAVWRAICARFDIAVALPGEVKAADNRALMTERRDLMTKGHAPWAPDLEAIVPLAAGITPWSPRHAEQQFMEAFDLYSRRRA